MGTPSKFTTLSRRKGKQQTIEDVLGKSSKPKASMPSTVAHSGLRHGNVEEDDSDDDEDEMPIRRLSRRAGKDARRSIHWSDPQASDGIGSATSTSPPYHAVSSTSAVAKSSPPALAGSSGRRDVIIDSDDDDDDDGKKSESTVDGSPTPPSSSAARANDTTHPRRRSTVLLEDSDGGDESEDESDQDARPAKRRRQSRPGPTTSSTNYDDTDGGSSSGDELIVLTPAARSTAPRLAQASTPASGGGKLRSARKKSGPRSARQRHMELLRRRRLGEKVGESDLESSSAGEEEPRVALYDKDPDYAALSDFEDEEREDKDQNEEAPDKEVEKPVAHEDDAKDRKKAKLKEKKAAKKKEKKENEQDQFARIMQLSSKFDEDEEDDGYDYEDDFATAKDDMGEEEEEEVDDDMADFIDDSRTGLIGAPDSEDAEDEEAMLRREIPLEFTFQAHKPLKSHFRDAVEWLVHRRINPGGAFAACDEELYRVAWDRLDREIGGLAQSRFISSSWTPEFHSALRNRPYMDSFNLRPSGGGGAAILIPGVDGNVCHACGRTNHPASFRVMFSGKAYDSTTLDDVEEADEDDEDLDSDDDNRDNESIDMHGNVIPPTSRQWYVGAICHSNAETAHDLLHWRRALKDWVEEKLTADGVLDPLEKGRKKKMKARKRRALANQVVDDWEANGTVNSLFRDFMKLLEGAQAKSTKTMSRYGR